MRRWERREKEIEGDVATCAVVANGAMHTVKTIHVSAAPVWKRPLPI